MKFRLSVVKAVGLGSLLFASVAMATSVVVTPGDAQGWFEKSGTTGTFGLGIADQAGGTSSLLMSTDGSAGQIINAARIPLIRINAITSLSWDVYTDQVGNYPRPQLEFWSTSNFGTLVYDTSNLTLTANTWTTVTVDLNSDLFWNTANGHGDLRTLAAWQAEPTVGSSLMNFFRMGYGSTGGGFTATTAYMDFVELNGTTWDFQDVALLPPEPPAPVYSPIPTLSQWTLILLAMFLGMVAFVRLRRKAQ